MKKKELPIWFKVETIVFLFFAGAIGINYLKMSAGLNGSDLQLLLTKLIILMGSMLIVWLVSLVVVCCDK